MNLSLKEWINKVSDLLNIEIGTATVGVIAGGGDYSRYVTVTFTKTYSAIPIVVPILTGEAFRGFANPYSISTTGAIIRVDNLGAGASSNNLKIIYFVLPNVGGVQRSVCKAFRRFASLPKGGGVDEDAFEGSGKQDTSTIRFDRCDLYGIVDGIISKFECKSNGHYDATCRDLCDDTANTYIKQHQCFALCGVWNRKYILPNDWVISIINSGNFFDHDHDLYILCIFGIKHIQHHRTRWLNGGAYRITPERGWAV